MFWIMESALEDMIFLLKHVTQSKSKTIITRSMLTISLIVFTDKLQGHVLNSLFKTCSDIHTCHRIHHMKHVSKLVN